MTSELHLTGQLTAHSLASVTANVTAGHPLTVDMSAVTFGTPVGLVSACVEIEALVKADVFVRVIAPRDPSVANYFARVHLPSHLSAMGVMHDFPTVRDHPLGNTMVELYRFDAPEAVERLAASAYDFAEPHGAEAAAQLHQALCEAGGNVCDHSRAGHGYLLAQYFRYPGKFEFAIGDSGIGFLGNLQQLGATDHDDALRMAAEAGITSTRQTGRGMGIARMREGLARLHGGLTLISGDASRYYSSNYPNGRGSRVTGNVAGSLLVGALATR